MMPRQLGPMMRASFWPASSTISATSRRGMRSVTITTSLTPFSRASNTASLVKAGGTVTTDPSIEPPWCSTAWATVSNTGTPCTSRPSRPGVTQPRSLAGGRRSSPFSVGFPASGRVCPWPMRLVFGRSGCSSGLSLDPLHGPPGRLVQRDGAVGIVDPVTLQDLEALFLPGSGDAEDCDLLGRVVPELQARLDHPPGHDVNPGVGHDRHH